MSGETAFTRQSGKIFCPQDIETSSNECDGCYTLVISEISIVVDLGDPLDGNLAKNDDKCTLAIRDSAVRTSQICPQFADTGQELELVRSLSVVCCTTMWSGICHQYQSLQYEI